MNKANCTYCSQIDGQYFSLSWVKISYEYSIDDITVSNQLVSYRVQTDWNKDRPVWNTTEKWRQISLNHSFCGEYIFLFKLFCKLLLPQKLYSINDGGPGGRRVESFQPHLQHPNETLVRVTLLLCSNGLQGGHREVEVDANVLPFVCYCMVESLHQVFYIWCGCYVYTWKETEAGCPSKS